MSNTLQDFLATTTKNAADELIAALQRVPEDKRDWNPEPKARTAYDQVAECAILNGYTARLISARKWDNAMWDSFPGDKTALLAQGEDALRTLLETNTATVIATFANVPDDALNQKIAMPWGEQTLAEILAYAYWNMTYHQGQINYIASLLER